MDLDEKNREYLDAYYLRVCSIWNVLIEIKDSWARRYAPSWVPL